MYHFINLSKKKKKKLNSDTNTTDYISDNKITFFFLEGTIKLLGHQNLIVKTSILFLLWTTIVVPYWLVGYETDGNLCWAEE